MEPASVQLKVPRSIGVTKRALPMGSRHLDQGSVRRRRRWVRAVTPGLWLTLGVLACQGEPDRVDVQPPKAPDAVRSASCFRQGELAGHSSAGDLARLALAAGPCAERPGGLEVFYDGAAHSFAFDLDDPGSAVAQAESTIDDERARISFLRGIFLSYGRAHPREPEAADAYVEAWPIIPAKDRHFGIANGMAWGLGDRHLDGVEEGFAQAGRLSDPIRFIYLEELGWQAARLVDLSGGQPGPHLAASQPEEWRCVVVHGIVRSAFSRDPDLVDARRWLDEQPDCRVHILHALRQAGTNRGQPVPGVQALLDQGLQPEDSKLWSSLVTLP